jgi:hypothetical protein
MQCQDTNITSQSLNYCLLYFDWSITKTAIPFLGRILGEYSRLCSLCSGCSYLSCKSLSERSPCV